MARENLLRKVRESLSHPEIVIYGVWERNPYNKIGKADFGWSYEIAPKEGVYHLDNHTKDSLVALRNRVFEELLSERYENRDIDFEDCFPFINWGVIPPGCGVDQTPDIIGVPGLRVFEPIGVREERKGAYSINSYSYILSEFSSEFTAKERLDEKTERHKATIVREAITRSIDVSLFPSIEYLRHLDEIRRERKALYALAHGHDSRKDYDRLKEVERAIGFVDRYSIYVPAYNSFFSKKR